MSQAILDLLETGSRLVLFLCAFIYIFPVLEYKTNGTGFLYVLQLLVQLTRLLTLALLLLNIPLTTYEPFGKTVRPEHSFLAKITGYRPFVAIPVLVLCLLTITREDEVEFVFANVNQTSSFDLTAYLNGSLDFFNEGVQFDDALDQLVQPLFNNAQFGLLGAAIVFGLSQLLRQTPLEEIDDQARSWYTETWQQRPETSWALGIPSQGPLYRNATLMGFAIASFALSMLDHQSATSMLLFVAELGYASALFVNSLWKVIQNLRGVLTPVWVAEIYLVVQLQLYVAITSPTLAGWGLGLYYAIAAPVLIIAVWLGTFNINLPLIAAWTTNDVRDIVVFNIQEPIRFFRLLQSLATSAGILAMFFAYYAYIGNAFEFDFSSGNAVVIVQGVVDDVESTFDGVIVDINNFIVSITPCSTTSDFWVNATSLGGSTPGAVSAAAALDQLRANNYFNECFDADNQFFRPPINVELCRAVIDNYDQLLAEEAKVSGLDDPAGEFVDMDFVDDEGNTLANEVFQVLKIDPECNEKVCIAFTVLTTALFAATLIPFVNIGAATAAKVARIAWRISRIGIRMLKYARKIYAKRSKLRRFAALVSRLAATGRPTLKFDIVIFFLFVPMITVGLLCMLLGFFRREGSSAAPAASASLSDGARFRTVVFFVGLTVMNLVLLIGLFGLSGNNSADFVQETLNNLPSEVIRSSVQYGSGMLYLRLSLLISMASSATMSLSLGVGGLSRYVRIPRIGASVSVEPPEPTEPALNYAILVLFLIAPVTYFALISYGDPDIRWFSLNALQDDRTSDIADQIAASEVVSDSVDVINVDVSEEQRSCGLIAVAAEGVYSTLLGQLESVVAPLLVSLRNLQDTAGQLLGQVRVGTFFAPINLNLPQADQSEFWVVFTLPIIAVILAILAIVGDLTNNLAGSTLPVGSIKGAVLSIGLVAFQFNIVIYSVFSALNGLDVPLFNIELLLGNMLINALYSSVFCITAGASLYLNNFLVR